MIQVLQHGRDYLYATKFRLHEALRVFCIALVSATFLLVGLGRGALIDWDEAIHAQVSKEILSSHEWLTLHWQHEQYFRKPPLSFWLRAALFQTFGVSEFWARAGSALAAVAVVVLVYAIAKRRGGAAGMFAAGALLTTRNFDHIARQGTSDALLCLCMYVAIYAYFCRPWGDLASFYLICVATGAGIMTKGPVILIAALAILIDLAIRKEKRFHLERRHYVGGALVLLGVVLPWHLWMMHSWGGSFVHEYFGHQMAERVSGVLEQSGGGELYYFRVLGRGAAPWCFVTIAAFVVWLRQKDRSESLLWIVTAITLLLFTCVPTKHEWYIAPVYPALAIENGTFLYRITRTSRVLQVAAYLILVAGMGLTVWKFSAYQGLPLANEMAHLSKVAGRESEGAQPLYVIAARNSEVDVPTAVFYSDRPVSLVSLPSETDVIVNRLKTHTSMEAIVEHDAQKLLPGTLRLREKERTDRFSFVLITSSVP